MPPRTPKTPTTVLQEVVNVPELVTAFGKTYEIKKFTLGQAARALEFINPIGYLLQQLAAAPTKRGKPAEDPLIVQKIVSAISISGESMMGLISIATQEPREWLDEQDAMDGLEILLKVVEKNLSFFSQKNIGKVTELIERLVQGVQQVGGDISTT
jgi:transcription termination factor Rho